MANNLALIEQADQFGGSGGYVLAIVDRTGSGEVDSFSATGLGFFFLDLEESAPEVFSATGAGNLELVDKAETLSFSMTGEVTGGVFAVSEGASEQISFTMPESRDGFYLALFEQPDTLAMTGKASAGNILALSEWTEEIFRGQVGSVSESVLRHVRNSV